MEKGGEIKAKNNKVQVITDDLDYNKSVDAFLRSHELLDKKNDYRSVAVIGCQSSGKSTLLNLLFETEFETMDNDRGRQQTTKGIWMSRSKDKGVLIYDIEGTDSKERGEQRMTFEQTTSLFALAIADVLMINMWTTDIGRYGASNYGLLKVIFECNLKLFGQSSSKKLIFVLRDFDDRGNNTERITDLLKTDINNIWKEIHKPEGFKDSKAEDFFNFEYCMIPHKIYEEERFYEKTTELKGRFVDGSENMVYLDRKGDDNIPIDGLSVYIDQTWDVIRNQKELNLPDQREMVANYRCNEIKEEALEIAQLDIDELRKQTDNKIISGFKAACEVPVNKALAHFDDSANQYQAKVYEKVRLEVKSAIMQNLFLCFDSQVKMIRVHLIDEAEIKIRKLSNRDIVNDSFQHQSQGIKEAIITQFNKDSDDLIIEGSGWKEQTNLHLNELNKAVESTIRNYREKEIQKLETLTSKATYDTIEELVSGPIYELNDNFWEEIREPYTEEIKQVLANCQQILSHGFDADSGEQEDFMQRFEKDVRDYGKNYIVKLFKDINTNLLRKFNSLFKNNSSGQQNNWVTIEEEDIRKMWSQHREHLIKLTDHFKYIEIPLDLASKVTTSGETPGMDDQIQEEGDGLLKSKSIVYGRLLTKQDIIRVTDRFEEDINNVLEEAIRKHHNVSQGNTPMWLYVVLAYFAYDDIFRMMANPILFYPLLFISSIVAMLYSMGLGPIMMPMARTSINTGFRMAGVPFSI